MKYKLMTPLQPQEPNKFVAGHRERSMADRAKFKVKLRESLTRVGTEFRSEKIPRNRL